MNTLYISNRAGWRKWLKKNHDKTKDVWLVYYKRHTKKPSVPYDDSVEEALCFGWIDGIIKRIDDERYARKFTPRTNITKWSLSNKKRLTRMIRQGKMTKIGLDKVDEETLNKKDSDVPEHRKKIIIPRYLKHALIGNNIAWNNFNNLAPSHKRNYLGWITAAKKDETRQRRIQEAIGLLKENRKLGLK
jgi:uncharacterized protein YdeI (YjbR/CyaY-like superfamily)